MAITGAMAPMFVAITNLAQTPTHTITTAILLHPLVMVMGITAHTIVQAEVIPQVGILPLIMTVDGIMKIVGVTTIVAAVATLITLTKKYSISFR
jgi:hypothetical protein